MCVFTVYCLGSFGWVSFCSKAVSPNRELEQDALERYSSATTVGSDDGPLEDAVTNMCPEVEVPIKGMLYSVSVVKTTRSKTKWKIRNCLCSQDYTR